MIDFRHVSKSYGSQDVLRDIVFQVNDGERVGIVGPNGAGKSTVFSLICREISEDKGSVEIPRETRIGHLRQQFSSHDVTETLLEYAESGRPDLHAIEAEMHSIETGLHSDQRGNRQGMLTRLGELQTRFEATGGYEARSRAESALSGLGFTATDLRRPFKAFSGGWQMRAELARVLVANPNILLLDEPTNYLDIPAIEWLQKYLTGYLATMLLISHDRYLLNSLTTTTIEIANGTATKYRGNYDYYIKERERRYEERLGALKNQQRERKQALRFIERFRAKNTKASQVQSKIKMVARMEEISLPRHLVSRGTIRLKTPARSGREVIALDNVGITYDDERWVLRNVTLSVQRGNRTAVIGPNGMGKSTLLRALANKLTPSEGKRKQGHNVVVGYQSQEFTETMDPGLTVFETVKSVGMDTSDQEIRTLLGGFGFSGEAVDKRVSVLSGGEKVRLAFCRLLVNPPNFLVLDEPTTHLDVTAREALEQALTDFEGTIFLVSHDIEFVRHVATTIIAMDPPGIRHYSGGYDYYCEKLDAALLEKPSRLTSNASVSDRKAKRRERAEEVQKRSVVRKQLKKDLARAERDVEKLEVERSELTAGIESGAPVDYETINKRLTGIQRELDRLTRRWERAASELEAL